MRSTGTRSPRTTRALTCTTSTSGSATSRRRWSRPCPVDPPGSRRPARCCPADPPDPAPLVSGSGRTTVGVGATGEPAIVSLRAEDRPGDVPSDRRPRQAGSPGRGLRRRRRPGRLGSAAAVGPDGERRPHTATEAYPSRTDIGLASEPNAHYVLVSTREHGNSEGPVEFRSYRIIDSEVTEEEVAVDDELRRA